MIRLTINQSTREGRLLGPSYLAAYAKETIEIPSGIPVGTSVVLLTPAGDPIAHALVAESPESSTGLSVALDTYTAQAVAYFEGMRNASGERHNAYLAVGDTDTLRAVIPVLVVTNPLDDLAPPPDMAPLYPTASELEAYRASLIELISRGKSDIETATANGITEIANTSKDTLDEIRANRERAETASNDALLYRNASESYSVDAAAHRSAAEDAAKRAEEALGYVPAVALDAAALRAASEALLGTDPASLLSVSETL